MQSNRLLSLSLGALVLAGCCHRPAAPSGKQTYSSFDLPAEHSARQNAREFTCRLEGVPPAEVLKLYENISGRTVIAGLLPDVNITLRVATPSSRVEVLQMLDTVLAQHRITMVLAGDRAVKAVPTDRAMQESPPEINLPWQLLPESSSYMRRTVHLQHLKPSETVPVLMIHARLPNSIIPMDSLQVVLLRDYAANIRQQLKLLEELEQKHSGK